MGYRFERQWKFGQEKASVSSREGGTSRNDVKEGSRGAVARRKRDILPALHKWVSSIGALSKKMCLMARGPSGYMPRGQRCVG